MHVFKVVETLLLCAWAGGAWFAGLIAAPQLFRVLPSAQAGTVAGLLFTSVFWLSLPAISVSLGRVLVDRHHNAWRLDAVLLAAALAASLTIELVLHPWIAAMRSGAMPRDAWFGIAHGASSILFLTNCLIAAVLVVRRSRC